MDWYAVDDVIFGCANQAGEDNRNVARMALLLAGLPAAFPARRSIGFAVRAGCGGRCRPGIRSGGSEFDNRRRREIHEPCAVRSAQGGGSLFPRQAEIYDTTIGWRFVNPLMKRQYGVDLMPETAEHVAEDYRCSRADQDVFACAFAAARRQGTGAGLAVEIIPVVMPERKGESRSSTRTSISGRRQRGGARQTEDSVREMAR